MAVLAEIAVENTAYHFDKAFDYLIPDDLAEGIVPGFRAIVPFGMGNAKRQGIILALGPLPEDDSKLKAVYSIPDREPLLTPEAVALVSWLKEHCFCTFFEAARLFFPAGAQLKIHLEYSLAVPVSNIDRSLLDKSELQMVEFLSHVKAPVPKEKLLKELGLLAESLLPEKLVQKGILCKNSAAVRSIADATRKMVRLIDGAEIPKMTARQTEVFQVLQDAGNASVKELCYFAGVTPSVVDALVKKGIAQYYEEQVYRTPYTHNPVQAAEPPREICLSEEQQNAFDRMYAQYRSGGGVSLLYGITGSGKTSVFMQLIDRVREEGRGVIVMVPEISLTPQTIALFTGRYGGGVAVFHSGLSLAERMDEWKRVSRGDASIVVGTRSAVFAPFRNLGLIIMDEEQESTYKSEQSPRYHARDVAKYRCAYHKALLVLSSATPSIESSYFALSAKYSLNVLKTRYGPACLPEVSVVDMNGELEMGNRSLFSGELVTALRKNLEDKRQSILLLNRRGYNTFVSCRACGHVLTCPNCSIALTFHAANKRLMCHYCGFSIPFTKECPSCHEEKVHYSGFGTQRVQQELQEILPQARILRLDADSTMTKFSCDKKLSLFADGEYDIIIGTQMVAKGLDFENVTLVGVLSADQSLYGDDFRSYERAFDLLTQVVGRSGRGKYKGRAIIQTFTPENNVIKLAAKQDYPAFYKGEIALRRQMLYPPFSDICVFGFVGVNENKVRAASVEFLSLLKRTAQTSFPEQPMRVLNPSPAFIGKVSNRYRYKLIVKCRGSKRLRQMISGLLTDFAGIREYAEITVFCDMNPETIL